MKRIEVVAGETPPQALVRELKEELAIDVSVGGKAPEPLEHEAAKWLGRDELNSVN